MKSKEDGGLGFTSVNISSILHGAGNNVGKAIDVLLTNKDEIRELMNPADDRVYPFTINQIKIKLFGIKSPFDLNSPDIEEFESAELLHQQSAEAPQLGRRGRGPESSPSQAQTSSRQRLQSSIQEI